MVQDDVGYIWFSTYDGLVRFDGLEFDVFNHVNTKVFPHNRITDLYYQKETGLWISIENGGIVLYKNSEFIYYGPENGFTKSNVRKIIELSNNHLLVLTNKGIYKFDGESFSQPYNDVIQKDQFINDVYEETDGSIWITAQGSLVLINSNGVPKTFFNNDDDIQNIWTTVRLTGGELYVASNKGLFLWDKDKFIRKRSLKSLDNSQIRYIHGAGDYLLIAAPDGLYSFKDEILKKLAVNSKKKGNNFSQIFRDSYNRYWLISQDGRLIIFKDGKIDGLTDLPTIERLSFNSFFEDKEHNIWLLTTRDGLIRLGNSKVRTLGVTEGISGSNILALLKDSKENLWVGTRGDGLNRIEGNKVTQFRMEEGLSSNTIQSLIEDNENNIWVGYSYRGLAKIQGNEVTNYEVGSDLESNDVRALLLEGDDQMWVGTYQGLVKFDLSTNQYTRLGKKEGLNGDKIRYMVKDNEDVLWIGTLDGGLSRFEDATFTNFTVDNGLSSNNIRSIYVDEYDPETLWIGTENNGLNRFKGGEFSYVSVEDGLPDYNIHWISQDESGWLWMSSNKGVFKILKSELNDYLDGDKKHFQLIAYGSEEGMRNPEGNGSFQEAGLRTKDGRFYFATQEGVAIFNSKNSINYDFEPQVVIKELRTELESFSEDSLNLDPKADLITIRFQVLSYANNSNTQFRYRFVNKDSTWINIGNDRELRFSSLDPGEYLIEIQASNGERGWSSKKASMLFVVNPRFYQQIWFYVLVLVILIGVYYLIVQLRYKMILKRQAQLEKTIDEQTRVIRLEKKEVEKQKEIIEAQAADLKVSNQTKDKFFSIIAHDLRNPFQAMVGYSDMLVNDFKDISEEELQGRLETMQSSSMKLLELTNNLLTWASLQTGKIKSEPSIVQLNTILEKNFYLFEQSALQKNIKIVIESNEPVTIFADQNMIDTIIRNLISNAMKFTNPNGEIELNLINEKGSAVLTVRDNGIGMDKDILANLFTIEINSSREGTELEQGSGLGLLLCKEMVDKNKGEIFLESAVGEGTLVTVEFPVYKE
jgi:signal transduction histidine kinase/ligand-binding sensor domain-containing protein